MIEQVNTPRRVHLVGSGGIDYQQYMELAAATVGPYLTSLPNGEPNRHNWVIEFIEDRVNNPQLRRVRRSRMSEPRPLRPLLDPPRYIPRGRGGITGDDLDLPFATEAAASLPIFQQVTTTYDLPTVRPQYGIPGPLDVAGFSWVNPLRHYGAECDAALREIDAIHELCRPSRTVPVFQLELPAETFAVARAPARSRERVADWLFGRVGEFVSRALVESVWIVHLCYGNKHNQALVSPGDCSPLAAATDALWRHWPQGQVLDAVHWPVGDAKTPPPAREVFWFPGSHLGLPATVHLSVGLARVGRPLGYLRGALHVAENTLGRRLGVSASCGGGRDVAMVGDTMRLLASLAVE